MGRLTIAVLVIVAWAGSCLESAGAGSRRITLSEYRDHMKAGWLGQMVGVSWGAPTEFRYVSRIIPDAEVPKWHEGMANGAFAQDDLYVEMTFLRTLEQHGLGVSSRQAGIDFANSRYPLWCANDLGRKNLRSGIAPPDSGHPKFNAHADSIDYEIEADFSGLIAPGLPNTAIALGQRFGSLMNHGDGLYAGQFIGGMYTEAFFERDPVKIVEFGLRCIPRESKYAECIRDVLAWYRRNPDDWEKTWQLVQGKYHENPEYRKFTASQGASNIDAKINGAYVVMGLLYGKGDPDKTFEVAVRCGQDSDCNPSSAMGVLFAGIGWEKLPERFKTGLDEEQVFSYTEYNYAGLVAVCEKLAGQAVVRAGGRIEKNERGERVLLIPANAPKPGKLERNWDPSPVSGSRFTADEMKQIDAGQSR
jgi:hypothetical protein